MDAIFASIEGEIESKGLILKKGTLVDEIIIHSANRTLSSRQKKRNKQNHV
ncbi:MAG: hypothetical protein ACRD6X_13305 [Pyrinomonadaceae bacterium]